MVSEQPGELMSFDTPPAGMFDSILQALYASSRDFSGTLQPHLLAIPLHNDAGVVEGGLWGCTLFQWLHVQLLFVPDSLRGKGVGSALVTMAEIEARKRGCVGAHVSSFSFQATPFYQKLGYVPFGQLDNYPPGHTLIYLRKSFDTPDPPTGQAEVRPRREVARPDQSLPPCIEPVGQPSGSAPGADRSEPVQPNGVTVPGC